MPDLQLVAHEHDAVEDEVVSGVVVVSERDERKTLLLVKFHLPNGAVTSLQHRHRNVQFPEYEIETPGNSANYTPLAPQGLNNFLRIAHLSVEKV